MLILTHAAGCSDYCMTSDLASLTLITEQEKIIGFVGICSMSPEAQIVY